MKNPLFALSVITMSAVTTVSFAVSDDLLETPRIAELSLKQMSEISAQTMRVDVSAILKMDETTDNKNSNALTWQMSPTDWPVLFTRIVKADQEEAKYDDLKIPQPESPYNGFKIQIQNRFGENLAPVVLYNGLLKSEQGHAYAMDPDRGTEYWLWGTSNKVRALDDGWKYMPVISFKQCIDMGNRLIETVPRQCLMTNGDIFLEIPEEPTQESIGIADFDDCLTFGQALINTFPRRCIAAGGHVYTEPPRVE
jgi:hypothetical protein